MSDKLAIVMPVYNEEEANMTNERNIQYQRMISLIKSCTCESICEQLMQIYQKALSR